MAVSETQKQHVRQLLIEGRKIEAIQYLLQEFKLPLREGKKLVELIDKDIREEEYQYDRTKAMASGGKMVGCAVGSVFAFIGAIMLIATVVMFIGNQRVASHGVRVSGKVVSDPSQPVIEYEFQGEIHTHYSTVSSDPPSYHIGEEVSILVDPDDPSHVIVDTFMERWFLITLFGGLGMLFFLMGIGVIALFRKIKWGALNQA